MNRSDKQRLAAAGLLVVLGLFLIMGSIGNIADRKTTESVPADLAVLFFVGVLPLVGGVWLVRHTLRGAAERTLEAREQTVMHLAGQHHGVLTVPQVAEEAGMTLEQAKAVLDQLYRKSFSEVSLAESGEMVYRFPLEP